MVQYRLLADLVVLLHASYVAFVVVGFVLILLGAALRWDWIRNVWFRAAHLAAISVVCIESAFGIVCPLTSLESVLRRQAGQASYQGDFIGHWIHELIFFDASARGLTVGYVLFGLLVAALFVLAPPRRTARLTRKGSR